MGNEYDLSMVGSSHSAPVCDGSSISEHGREFSDMGSDTGFYGLGVPPQSRAAAYLRYLGRRTRFPIRPLTTLDRVDLIFSELRRAIVRPSWWERHRQACI